MNEHYIDLAHRLASTASDITLQYFRKDGLQVDSKADSSPVTKADRQAESAMRALIRERFPDHGIFGEEHGTHNGDAEYMWILDPIDGTRAFIDGRDTFTTLIALCHHNVPVLGLIDQPVRKERWLGIKDAPTLLNGQPVNARSKPLEEAVIATTGTQYFSKDENAHYQRVAQACAQEINGQDAYAYAQLASGRIDLVIEANLKPYDFCALVPVLEGAGAIVTDWHDQSVNLLSDGTMLVAGDKTLHNTAFALLHTVA